MHFIHIALFTTVKDALQSLKKKEIHTLQIHTNLN